jgi:hypothetical protein
VKCIRFFEAHPNLLPATDERDLKISVHYWRGSANRFRTEMNAIRDIFNEVQKSAQTHKLCVKKLAAAINSRGSEDQENITYFLNGGIDRILLHPGGGASMDRSVSFLGAFLATVEERVLFMTIQHICSRLQSSNKLVRQRVCLLCSRVTLRSKD